MSERQRRTPPLGHEALTPLYDIVIAALTREGVWRKAVVQAIAPQPGDRILDVGSGTGSLAVLLCSASAGIHYVGVDPDAHATMRARQKTAALGGEIEFSLGYFSTARPYFDGPPNKIVSSLVLHQTPLAEKRRILSGMYKYLVPGGTAVIADYGRQTGLMRLVFRMTVQALDGVVDTQSNADGAVPILLREAGFGSVCEQTRIDTATGTISIYRADK